MNKYVDENDSSPWQYQTCMVDNVSTQGTDDRLVVQSRHKPTIGTQSPFTMVAVRAIMRAVKNHDA
jgi:hypothetical protein